MFLDVLVLDLQGALLQAILANVILHTVARRSPQSAGAEAIIH